MELGETHKTSRTVQNLSHIHSEYEADLPNLTSRCGNATFVDEEASSIGGNVFVGINTETDFIPRRANIRLDH
jgi:hypothetical protein